MTTVYTNLKNKISNFYKKNVILATAITFLFVFFVASTGYAINLISNDTIAKRALAAYAKPTESAACNFAAQPTFNGMTTLDNTGTVNSTTCSDMPMLSFFPINTVGRNPRILDTQNGQFSLHVSYMNSGLPTTSIQNPNLKMFVTKVSATQWKISATLSSANAGTLTSAADGGDLFVNVPADRKLEYVKNTTNNYPDAVERKWQAQCSSVEEPGVCLNAGKSPNDKVPDNSGLNSNPIFAEFTGGDVAATTGFNLVSNTLDTSVNRLNGGFLDHGYLLTDIAVKPAAVNLPPVINPSRVEIIRGQGGQFPVKVITSDTDNKTPADQIIVTARDLPTWVTPQTGYKNDTQFVIPKTDATTPAISTFYLTPQDGDGLFGAEQPWVIVIIDPSINITKTCTVKATQAPCGVQKPGDVVIYKLNVKNTSDKAPLTNVVLTDDYDETTLTSITNVNPAAVMNAAGYMTWNIGNMAPLAEFNASFEMTVRAEVANATTIINIANVVSNETPKKEVKVPFTVEVKKLPPVINPSEVTIIRGQGGQFPVKVITSDTDNKTPADQIIVTARDLPTWVTPQTGYKNDTQFVIPKTDATTPAVTTFYLTPKDGDGLTGTEQPWIIRIIDPSLNLTKSCVVKNTTNPCTMQKPGDVVTYKLNAKNNGAAPLTGVVLTDDYDQTKLEKIENINPAASSKDDANGILVWNIGNMAVNAEFNATFDATIKSGVVGLKEIINTAKIKSDQTPEIERKVPFTVNTPPTINGSIIEIPRGQGGQFPVTVQPKDNEDTPDKITVTPKNLPTWVTPQVNIKDGTTIVIPTTDVNTPVETVFTLTPTDTNGAVGEPGVWIIRIVDPKVELTKTCIVTATNMPCATQKSGDKVTYVIKAINTGAIDLTNVKVTDDYDETKLNNISNINPKEESIDLTKGIVVWNVGKMAKGVSAEFKFDAVVKDNVTNTSIDNIVVLTSKELPPKEAKVTFVVGAKPLLSITKACNSSSNKAQCKTAGLKAKNEVDYTIVVKNDGSATATNVRVLDDYDQTKIGNIVNINPAGKLETTNGTISWELGDLAAGKSITLTYRATINDTVVNGDIVNNIATVTGDNLPPASGDTTFPILMPIANTVTPRTGGLSILTAWATLISLSSIGYYFFSKRNKTGADFAGVNILDK
jgi:hypothetical protein